MGTLLRMRQKWWLILVPVIFSSAHAHRAWQSIRLESGWVCGLVRTAQDGSKYASFRGVPYAKQPIGRLRFKELQPAEPWSGCLDASVEGPVCPHHHLFFGPLSKPRGISEACIFANIHVPMFSRNGVRWLKRNLPIVVYIHPGPLVDGSGDSDMNGPENLVSRNVILVTFNYRMDAIGFISFGTAEIPGNNGIRDVLTLLRWIQTNARNFGGNPNEVTLAGVSGGGTVAHLLSLSPLTKGLIKRLWVSSGNALEGWYTTNPSYANKMASDFLKALSINSTNYNEVHDMIVDLPIRDIMRASSVVLEKYGSTTFGPVLDSCFPNVSPIITDNPDKLIAKGYGNDIPIVIGFQSNEAESIRRVIECMNITKRYQKCPLMVLRNFKYLWYSYPRYALRVMAKKIGIRYFQNGPPTIKRFIKWATETTFAYPALKLARLRVASGGAPVHLYKFSYDAEYSAFKIAFGLNYTGAGHYEDFNRIMKVNSLSVPAPSRDDRMTDWMTDLFANYAKYGTPQWPAVSSGLLRYQNITSPQFSYVPLTEYEQEMMKFYDNLTNI